MLSTACGKPKVVNPDGLSADRFCVAFLCKGRLYTGDAGKGKSEEHWSSECGLRILKPNCKSCFHSIVRGPGVTVSLVIN